MHNTEEKITVKYRTEKDICHCCNQKLEKLEISGDKEFDFYLQNIKEYAPWNHLNETEAIKTVEEFVYNTISFYATSYRDKIVLLEGEMNRVYTYINENLRGVQR